jgi:hypothetical protein
MTHKDPEVGDIWRATGGVDRDGFALYNDEFDIQVLVLELVIPPSVVKVQVISAVGERFSLHEKLTVNFKQRSGHSFPPWHLVTAVS